MRCWLANNLKITALSEDRRCDLGDIRQLLYTTVLSKHNKNSIMSNRIVCDRNVDFQDEVMSFQPALAFYS